MYGIYVLTIWSYENGNIYEKEFDGDLKNLQNYLKNLQNEIGKDVIMNIRFEKIDCDYEIISVEEV